MDVLRVCRVWVARVMCVCCARVVLVMCVCCVCVCGAASGVAVACVVRTMWLVCVCCMWWDVLSVVMLLCGVGWAVCVALR